MTYFQKFSGLKLNTSTCEVTGIGGLKRADVALYSTECIIPKKDSLKSFGIYFSYKKIRTRKKF